MKKLKSVRKRKDVDHKDLDLAPMLSLMVAIIPLLLASAVFYKVRIFDSSVFPNAEKVQQTDGADEFPITFVEVKNKNEVIVLVKKGEKVLFRTERRLEDLEKTFKGITVKYPEMKSLKISSNTKVSYKDLIHVFDMAKQSSTDEEKSLYKDVSLDDIFKG